MRVSYSWHASLVAFASVALLGACSAGGSGQVATALHVSEGDTQSVTLLGEQIMVPGKTDIERLRQLAQALEAELAKRPSVVVPAPDAAVPVELQWREYEGELYDPTLQWDYALAGDYDQNGAVGIADLSPLGYYFGLTSSDPRWAEAALRDGDGNGEIGISDVVPIARNFGLNLSYYVFRIEGCDETGVWHDLARVPFRDYYTGMYYQYDLSVPKRFRLELPEGSDCTEYRARLLAPPLPPPPPSRVEASFGSYADRIELAWSAVDGAKDYQVYRDDLGAPVTTTGTATSWRDTAAEYGVPHEYWIKATSQDGASELSRQAGGLRIAWDYYALDNAGNYNGYPAIANVSGHPAIAYFSGVSPVYATPNTGWPRQTSDWDFIDIGGPYHGAQTGFYPRMLTINGYPFMASGTNGGDALPLLARGLVPDPRTAADWAVSSFGSGDMLGSWVGLAADGEKPVACYFEYLEPAEGSDLRRLVYCRSTVAQPQSPDDWVSSTICYGTGVGNNMHLIFADGKPALAWGEYENQRVVFARALTAEPQSEADWIVMPLANCGEYYTWVDLELISGVPAVSYLDASGDWYESDLVVAQATSPSPQSATDWTTTRIDHLPASWATADLAVVHGRPLIAYQDYVYDADANEYTYTARLAWALNSQPQSARDWGLVDIAGDEAGAPWEFSVCDWQGLPALGVTLMVTYQDDYDLYYAAPQPE